jgi:hypothetical protein
MKGINKNWNKEGGERENHRIPPSLVRRGLRGGLMFA